MTAKLGTCSAGRSTCLLSDDPILSVSFAAIELEWARGSVATPYGPIHAAWRRNATGAIEITCHAPPECRRVEGPLADIHPDLAYANE